MRNCPRIEIRRTYRWRGSAFSSCFGLIVPCLVLAQSFARPQSPADEGARASAALRSGDYAAARNYFDASLRLKPDGEVFQIGLLQTLRETGAYDEAAKRAADFLATREDSPALHYARGRIEVERGNDADAEKHLRRAITLSGNSLLRLEIIKELAGLLEDTGRRLEANSLWDGLIREYRSGRVKGGRALGGVAVAAWRRGYARDAKDIFLDATDGRFGEEASLETLSDFGYLFLEKYNATEAIGVFRDCLEINKVYPPALVGMALAKKYESNSEAERYSRAALAVNPNSVPALTLLAELRMDEEAYDRALRELKRALAVNPANLDALSLVAVCHQFQGDTAAFAATEKKVLDRNPGYGRIYHTLAKNLVMRRKYREAVEQDRKAIRLDPGLWPAHSSLGMNLMRLGDLTGGRVALQHAFDNDPFNIWAYNTLDLLDQMDGFVRTASKHFVFLMAKEDEASLSAYAPKLAEEAYQQLTQRYGFIPEGPIQVEVYPDHGGFAVRTLGLPGLGALGVCFGNVVAIDSPRARSAGTFNWGSTLWHELAHVITLQTTRLNIPRWYSEGLSVYEEHRARPGWGDDLAPAFIKAYKEGKLLKVSELNAGMMRPAFPEQIGLSYYQASLFCEWIEQKFGFEKIRQSLSLFAQDKPARQVFLETLGWDTAALDREYSAYLDTRLSEMASRLDFGRMPEAGMTGTDKRSLLAVLEGSPADFFANLRLGAILRKEKANAEAEKHLKMAQGLFPQYTGPGNPYQALSEIYLEEKREDEALAQLTAWVGYDETAVAPLIRAAEIYRGRRDWTAAASMLELSIYIYPYDPGVFSLLGMCAGEAGDWASAASAYQVLVRLNPPDPAGAHYSLAHALFRLGQKAEAKRETLRALEIAPTYGQAQRLLLELSGAQP